MKQYKYTIRLKGYDYPFGADVIEYIRDPGFCRLKCFGRFLFNGNVAPELYYTFPYYNVVYVGVNY